jgi:hypothetical protein
MRKLIGVIVVAIGCLSVVGMAQADGTFTAVLSGANEVPLVETNTSGRVRINFNADDTAAEFQLQVLQGVGITQAHIHCGPAGVNAPIVVFLAGLNSQGYNVNAFLPWIFGATVTDSSVIPRTAGTGDDQCPIAINNLRDLIALIRAGNAYANVHSLANRGGEVRGQLVEGQ